MQPTPPGHTRQKNMLSPASVQGQIQKRPHPMQGQCLSNDCTPTASTAAPEWTPTRSKSRSCLLTPLSSMHPLPRLSGHSPEEHVALRVQGELENVAPAASDLRSRATTVPCVRTRLGADALPAEQNNPGKSSPMQPCGYRTVQSCETQGTPTPQT